LHLLKCTSIGLYAVKTTHLNYIRRNGSQLVYPRLVFA
jgi:hypothetical protein